MAPQPPSEVLQYAPAQPPKGALLAIFLVVLVDMLGFGLVIPLLPFYARQFEASAIEVTLLFSIFSICQFFAAPLLGGWSDRVGRRPVLILSLLGNACGYVLLAWASAHHWTNLTLGLLTLYLSRTIAGLTAGNISAAQAYVSDVTPPEQRTKGMGILGAAFGIGFSIGPFIGSMLAHYLGSSAPAWLAAVLAIGAAVLCVITLKEARPQERSAATNYLDLAQFAPLVRNRNLLKINASWFIAMAAFVGVDSAITMFLIDVFHYQQREVGWYFLVVGIVITLTQGGLVGRLSRQFGEWRLCIAGLTINGVGSVLTALTAWIMIPSQATAVLFASAAIYAFGRSLFQPTIFALVSHHSDPEQQGLSFGFFQAVGTLARILGPLGAGLIYQRHLTMPWFIGAAMLWATAAGLAVLHRRESHQAQQHQH